MTLSMNLQQTGLVLASRNDWLLVLLEAKLQILHLRGSDASLLKLWDLGLK